MTTPAPPALWPGNRITLAEQSFETGQGSWAISSGTNTTAIARTQARASDGTWSITWQTSATGSIGSGLQVQQLTASGGQVIGFEFDMYYDGANTPTVQRYVNWFAGINGAWLTDTITSVGGLAPGGWRRYQGTVTVPTSPTNIGAFILHIRLLSGTVGVAAYLDRVIVGPIPPADTRRVKAWTGSLWTGATPRGRTPAGTWAPARILTGSGWSPPS